MGMGKVSRADLDVCLEVYPPGPGFYVGEKDGEVIASAIRIPWGDGVYYGSYYYVEERFRRGGYGTRLRDEVCMRYICWSMNELPRGHTRHSTVGLNHSTVHQQSGRAQ